MTVRDFHPREMVAVPLPKMWNKGGRWEVSIFREVSMPT